jgi:hypothetical protein
LVANTADVNATATDGSAAPGQGVPAPSPAPDASGVVLKLQSEVATASAGLTKGLVYANDRKAAANGEADSDVEQMAAKHSQAVLSNAGSTTKLTVDKNGVLVAGAASATETKPQDFVTFAVGAMRDYADEQERLKAASQPSGGPSAASLLPRSLAEVQKLAARFKLFA